MYFGITYKRLIPQHLFFYIKIVTHSNKKGGGHDTRCEVLVTGSMLFYGSSPTKTNLDGK